MKIGFIGTGNMGFPMLKGAIKEFGASDVTYTAAFHDELESVKERTGVPYIEDNKELMKVSDYIVLCVKPQFMGSVFEELKSIDLGNKVIISIVAGTSIAVIREKTGQNVKVARAMPNTPALVSEGMSAVCFSDDEYPEKFTDEERKTVERFFSSFGRYVILKENLIDAAMCANGCSPAYVYMFIEALADSAVKYGIPRKTAYELVAQTVLGAAKMVLERGEHPGKLKDDVCSPGGTTIAGVSALEEAGFRSALIKATDACYEKAQQIAKK
ncbi:MAG: pyrroline-5-carboxylate reductase [Lachnospiraceae bacterium]|nr:pyrroline-5-carboxylate reductase [Lachnospiraceae bacterium]